MGLMITAVLMAATMLATVIMWISGNGFYLCYVPAGIGEGITQYSPIWFFVVELAVAYAIFKRKPWGPLMLFAPALAAAMDIYPAWVILGRPDDSLRFHIAITALMWLTALTGVFSHRYFQD